MLTPYRTACRRNPIPQKRRLPSPYEVGIGMTVCIAAMDSQGNLVTASDQMLSMSGGTFTADETALKSMNVTRYWRVLYAADDVGIIPALIRRISAKMSWTEEVKVDQMAAIARDAFQAERRDQAVA